MSKKGIHPETHSVEVVLADNSSFKIETTWGKEGDVMKLDVDPTTHPAWKTDQGTFVNTNNDRISKFKKKYGGAFGNK